MVEVHRCRFVDFTPHSITNLKFSHPSTSNFAPTDLRLAVARNNGDIEIWNPKHKWIQETTLYGARDRSIEGLVWASRNNEASRLFSIGGSTFLTEWNLQTGLPLINFDCNAAVIWSLAINESQDKIAVGCDDGTVVIVDISGGPGSIEHHAFLQRQESRVLSLTWKGDDYVIGGCADGRIRVWATSNNEDGANKNNLIYTMRVDKSKTESTLVWSVLYLPKLNQIVSGDSTGSVKFWDFEHFTLSQTYKVHDADILTITASLNNETVFTAGVDRKIFKFQLTTQQEKTRWMNTSNRLLHSNDIRSMVSYESKNLDYLVSGGVEKSLVIIPSNSFTDGQYQKLTFIPQNKHVTSNKAKKLLILWQDQTVKIWRIGKKSQELVDDEGLEVVTTAQSSKDSYELVSKLTLVDDENITTVAISPDGSLLAVGRLTTTKLFTLSTKPNSHKLRVSKVDNLNIQNQGSKCLAFHGNESLILTTPENEIYKFNLQSGDDSSDDESQSIVEYELSDLPRSRSKLPYLENINQIKISHDQLIVSRISGAIDLVDLSSSEETKSVPFLRLSSFICNMEVSPRGTLVAITNENKVYEFDLSSAHSTAHLTPWSKANSEFLPQQFTLLQDPTLGLFFDEADENKIWIYGATWLAYFNLKLNIPTKNSKKDKKRNRQGNQVGVKKSEVDEEAESDEEHEELLVERPEYEKSDKNEASGKAFSIIHKYKPILFASSLGLSENNVSQLIIVERPPFALEQQTAFNLPKYRI